LFSHARNPSRTDRSGDQPVRSIVVLRALHLGDLLCAVPAFRSLRAAFPAAHIGLIGLPWVRDLISHLPGYVDETIEFPGFPGIPEAPFDPVRFAAWVSAIQARRFDLAVQMHGSGLNSNAFVALLGAGQTSGHHPPGGWVPDPESFTEYPAHGSEVDRCLDALAPLGIEPNGRQLEFRVVEADRRELDTLATLDGVHGRPYVCLHPGARHRLRRWPAERFVAVGRTIAASGLMVVVTGADDERDVTAWITAAIGKGAVDLAGQTSLGALAALIADARLLVANDTGVAHLAEAVGTPSVIVFTHTDPDRWAAADRSLHRVVATQTQPNPCAHRDGEAHRCLADACSLLDRSGAVPVVGDVPVEAVLTGVEDLLGRQESARVA
jgi:ADP-heptose:LPS heptosyltransferase